ncbi:probable G-protein coupled receptor Mth-like 3 isoform X2 [Culex pipiens pallens]|uniref:probable G-protein coupled receptor Mth-like 3 isoform X2 n=1 Tax=Culex pipiens pallens TaxID=42434 RepID=UPI0022AA9C69|nr:probable G-protein coupled receptor Mth-like 3 isoform X2 [Culex pipiens pallens]
MDIFGKILAIQIFALCITLVLGEYRTGLPCEFTDSINITESKRIYPNGSILHNNLLYKPQNYAWINYTFQSNNRIDLNNSYYRGCVCQVTNCVWLCCHKYSDVNGIPTCTDPEFKELLVDVVDQSGAVYEVDLIGNSSLWKALRYPYGKNRFGFYQDEWSMNSTGFVSSVVTVSQQSYCFNRSHILSEISDDLKGTVITFANITSIVFMLLTLIIYLCIPELRNVHGKCFICYVFSMLCSYTLLVFTKLDYKLYYCYYYQYFWIMAGFFWLNVLCFDIFWTFSSCVVKKDERKRFLKYSLYAWGCPMLLLGLIVLIDNTSFVPEDFRPNITADHCYFGDLTAAAIYLYSLMMVLVLVNIFFFVMTAIRILRVQRATDVALQRGSRRHSSVEDRYRIHLYLRLFVVMGVSWIFEVASFIACPEGSCMDDFLHMNSWLGLIIFLMFVCKTSVKQMILKRHLDFLLFIQGSLYINIFLFF